MSAPKIDPRNSTQILKQITDLVPFYTPEWKAAEETDSGMALLKIFAQMLEGVINRLNQVPDKNFIAFLNMLGFKLLPAEQARAPVTFMLSTGATEPVLILSGTQVSAAPAQNGEPVVFETENNILVTPATLMEAISTSPEHDSIFSLPPGFLENQITSFSATLVSTAKLDEKKLFLDKTDGLAQGDIIKIEDVYNPEYVEVFQITDTKVDLIDKIKDYHSAGTTVRKVTDLELFSGKNIQQHILYLAHRDLFNIKDPVEIKLEIDLLGNIIKLISFNCVTWEYWGEKTVEGIKVTDWYPFDSIFLLPIDSVGYIATFIKNNNDQLKEHEINGIKSFWIRCIVNPLKINDVKKVEIDTIKVNVKSCQEKPDVGKPDLFFYNDVPLDNESDEIYPFGRRPKTSDIFYIASQEVFSKKGLKVLLKFNLELEPEPDGAVTELNPNYPSLSWEYWNGTGWVKLGTITENFSVAADDKVVEFQCPSDITPTVVNGQLNYWIKTHIISGDYGREEMLEEIVKENGEEYSKFVLKPNFKLPKLKNFRVDYEQENFLSPETCITFNNLEYRERTEENKKTVTRFKPFYPLDDAHQALYLGFDTPPLKGPMSFFFSLEEQEYTEFNRPRIEWEYLRVENSTGQWVKLEVLDETQGLTQTGILEFIGPPDFGELTLFGKKLFWIRAVDVEDKFQPINPYFLLPEHLREIPPAPKIKAIHLNTVYATQVETVKDEILGSSDGTGNQTFTFLKSPVISEEVFINEVNSLTGGEMKSLKESNRFVIEEIIDDQGNVSEFRVKWEPVEDIKFAGATDRVYEMDRAKGKILFGDGVNGAVPPMGTDNIRANYCSGGGAKGNVGVGEIKDLSTSIAFVDNVSNPEAAFGGFDTEIVTEALARGPLTIKNRNRAVTVEDYENLALQASRGIARAKCLPDFNDAGLFETGWVTILIVPGSNEIRPTPSRELKRRVENYLRERAVNVVVSPRYLMVRGPVFIEISVNATLIAASYDTVPIVEQKAFEKVRDFLHPLTGGQDSIGWDFGRLPCLSDIFNLLESINGMDHVERLSMVISDQEGNQIEVTSDQFIDAQTSPYALIYSGSHSIVVKGPAPGS